MLLGPTSNFVRHTRQALQSLSGSEAAEVLSLPELWRRIYPALSSDGESTSELYQDNAAKLGAMVREAARAVDQQGHLRSTPSVEAGGQHVYEALKMVGQAKLTRIHARWSDYLANLPEWSFARRQPRFHSLLACCVLYAMPVAPRLFDHLIVDEAQDVTPLAWHMLQKLNHRRRWTIVGDMNQRSFDWSLPTWDDVASASGIDLSGGEVHQEFRSDYRSTQGILAFANTLLPEQSHHAQAIQSSIDRPRVLKYPIVDLPAGIVSAVEGLRQRHPMGTLAVIATDDAFLRTTFARADWRTERDGADEWTREGVCVRLLSPQEARGLEFDGVVVVEPGSFPRSDGSDGPLYTSLTRANRELVVVHSRGLPAALRRAARSA